MSDDVELRNGLMKITFKLFATLTDYLPPEAKYTNFIDVEVPPETTIGKMIETYCLPEKWVHLVLVNGSYIAPADRANYRLSEGDALAIWPPIAGG